MRADEPPAEVEGQLEATSDVPCRWLVMSCPGERDEIPVLHGPPDVERLTRAAAAGHGITFAAGL